MTSPSQENRLNWSWVYASLLFLVVGIVYWPAVHGAMLWDDPAHVTRPELQSWAGLWRIWTDVLATQQYYPVLHSAFWFEHRLWGDATFGYHLLNLVLHAGACCLFAVTLRRLWTLPGEGTLAPLPTGSEWIAALIFAVHPMSVESVAWISEQKNTLSLCFYLLSALAYFRFVGSRRLGWYLLASILFVLALGSKTVTATLPAALLVVLWWRNGRLAWRRDVLPVVPWFVVAIVAGQLTAWLERNVIGASGARFDLGLMDRVLLAGRVIWFYFEKLIWPSDLMFFYPHWNVPEIGKQWFGYLAAAIAVTIALWFWRKRGRGPLATWLLFGGGLFPALGFFNVYPFQFSYTADHFQYLPSIALIGGLIVGVAQLLNQAAPRWRVVALVATAGLAVALGVGGRAQAGLYRDNETLARATLERNPDSWMAHDILATALAKKRSGSADAIAEFRAALRLNPDYAPAHVAIAAELAKTPGGRPEAIEHYRRGLELNPRYTEAHNNLAVELMKSPGHRAEAIKHYEEALKLNPEFAQAHVNLANALVQDPKTLPEAMAHYEEALRLEPGSAEAHGYLANALARAPGRINDAVNEYQTALRLEANLGWVHRNLAFALAQIPGRQDDAIAEGEKALALNPNDVEAYNALAIIYARGGNLAQARAHWEGALRIDPNYRAARENLRVLDEMAAAQKSESP